ncbi:Putative transmembrane transport protein [Rhodococcus wratislaviensis]|uniref:Transmembrane transport protein n=1 Tax=Rhodococcus wratislaviensis TaxID=44752 RepID=A0A402CFD5_RHOWR|nr:Putative transmembrane transport protein [Rhodococcus wratislaviensis]
MVFAILGQIDRELLLAWVWRVPFLASIFLIAVAVFIRLRMQESPTTFLKVGEAGPVDFLSAVNDRDSP